MDEIRSEAIPKHLLSWFVRLWTRPGTKWQKISRGSLVVAAPTPMAMYLWAAISSGTTDTPFKMALYPYTVAPDAFSLKNLLILCGHGCCWLILDALAAYALLLLVAWFAGHSATT